MKYQCPKEYRRNRKREALELIKSGVFLMIYVWGLLFVLFI